MNDKSNELTIEEKIKNRNMLINEEELNKVSSFIEDFDAKKDKYKRTLEAQGYVAARRTVNGNYSSIAKNLGLPYGEFKYYLETKPEFSAAIRKGLIDAKEDVKEQLIDSLLNKAKGMTLKETKTECLVHDGETIEYKRTILEKEVSPDTQSILEVLRHLDPTWNPKTQLDVNVNNSLNINVTENKLVSVDLKNLSPEALREILTSQKAGQNTLAYKREDGKSINSKDINDVIEVEEKVEKPKRTMSEETKEKIRQSRLRTKLAKEQMKKDMEDKIRLEETKNE